MRRFHLLPLNSAASALLTFAAQADAQPRPPPTFHPRSADGALRSASPIDGGARINLPTHSNHFSWERGHGFKRGFFPVFVVEREVPVIVEREIVREAPVTPPPTPPHQGEGSKRKPYVVGGTYASLPGGCMKMIEEGASYYYCGGEWYRQVRDGRSPLYKAVARKL